MTYRSLVYRRYKAWLKTTVSILDLPFSSFTVMFFADVESLVSLTAGQAQDAYSTPDQLADELLTLTLLPRSKWQTLLNIEVIQVSSVRE